MKALHLLLAGVLTAPLLLPSTALAQDDPDYDDLDGEGSVKQKKERKPRKRPEVREIVRGWYGKSNVGASMYLGQFAGVVNPGTNLGLNVGYDFLDRERMSAAVEMGFNQAIHNGAHYEEQAAAGGPFVQGDLRTYTTSVVAELSFYPGRRFGVGLRAGGGLMMSPLLMADCNDAEERGQGDSCYQTAVVQDAWGGNDPGYHSSPHPVAMGGPTFEYYTKLSHFSAGLDADVFYAIGFDLGANVTGYLKYTF